ncbi:MAG: ABC transporter ATP-binding protein [Candidatus Eisenbacteria bacterium]|nr:ABC transporter ATP-binding protein [Candidatus Eisenbacteria bacterium]
MSQALLKVRDLRVAYGGIQALRGVSLDVREGEIVTLIGANGAGKTTLLRSISGLIRPRSGSIQYTNCDLCREPAHRIVKRGLCHVPEGRMVFANLTVRENLQLGAYLRNDSREVAGDLESMYTLFPRLRERMSQSAGTLSGGEQQMLAIARALMGRPKVLLMDEPSLGLAPLLVQEIFRTIREINAAGMTILLVEQNAHMALSVAHRGYVLETGEIVLQGPARELASNEDVKKAYLGH